MLDGFSSCIFAHRQFLSWVRLRRGARGLFPVEILLVQIGGCI